MERKVTVGRIVHYYPLQACRGGETLDFYAGIVTKVLDQATGEVHLHTFGPLSDYKNLHVKHSATPQPGCWSWPPHV